MAINIQTSLIKIFQAEFEYIVRYRCLIIQNNILTQYTHIKSTFASVCNASDIEYSILTNQMMFDNDGIVKSCNEVIFMIESKNQYIFVEGPLHFLDKWTDNQKLSFWNHFAYYSQEAYILFCDISRNINGSFKIHEQYSNNSMLFLKSKQSKLRIN